MLKVEHIAIWVDDLERTRTWYETYLGCVAGPRYHNPTKGFTSYFLTPAGGGARLELMHRADAGAQSGPRDLRAGWTHVAFTPGSQTAVNALTERLRADGYPIAGEPRTTGDGYYESVVEDPEGNRVELMA